MSSYRRFTPPRQLHIQSFERPSSTRRQVRTPIMSAPLSMPFVHDRALVESKQIGAGTRIWAFAQVMHGATIGDNCNIGGHAFIESGACIGNNVTVKNQVCIWDGVTIEDDVFVGPRVTFTNDLRPRSPRMPLAAPRYATREGWLEPTLIQRGCSIGAGAIVLPGICLSRYSMIAAGSVVTKNVPPHALVCGVPARRIGTVCFCGTRISDDASDVCATCGTRRSTLDDVEEQQS